MSNQVTNHQITTEELEKSRCELAGLFRLLARFGLNEGIDNHCSCIETQEGYFGPLLFGGELRTFFIVLHPGQFLAEHAHAIESIVYTVSGNWVLCSEGNRQVMKPGTLFHFGNDKPTGWEAPFNEEAHLLVFKKRTPDQNYESYMAGLADMQVMMDEEMEKGMTLWYHQIGPEHPARQFAAQVNPDFDQLIEKLESR